MASSYICYQPKNFKTDSRRTIEQVAEIIEEYQAAGYTLTLRQLHYQMVSRELQANTMKAYKRLGGIVNDAKLAGLLPWDAIEDRTRNLKSLSTWDDASDIIDSAAAGFRLDRWADQEYRLEKWIEKDALTGVIEKTCEQWRVPYFACRGNVSGSELWAASQRHLQYIEAGQKVVILHMGDHDPSGIDMTRDNQDRLSLFTDSRVEVRRLALTIDQVKRLKLPPNPAKQTDSRFEAYAAQFGTKSWELDAPDPKIINRWLTDAIKEFVDMDAWKASGEREETARAALTMASDNWDELSEHIRETYS